MPLQIVEPLRLYRQIAGQIATLIDNGEYPAGSRLPAERELAALLGVSRTSVREAIISLEIAGRVEVRVGSGIFVRGGERPEAPAARDTTASGDRGAGPFELLAARKLIEGEIAVLAARHASATDVAGLRASITRMQAAVDDFDAREAADRAFHVGLAKATGNGSLELVVEGLWDQRAELWRRTQQHFHTRRLAEATVRDHAAIAKAVAAGDGAAARAAMHRHLARVEREFQREDGAAVRATRAGKGVRAAA